MNKLNYRKEFKYIYVFKKNSMEEVRVSIGEFGRHKVCDFRVWGSWYGRAPRPKKKGLTLSIGLLPELKKAVAAVETAIAKNGGGYEGSNL